MTMRTFAGLSAMNLLWHGDLKRRASSGSRLERQLTANRAHTFFDHPWTTAERVELRLGKPSLERKPLSIIVYFEPKLVVACGQADEDMLCGAVAPHVHQRFLHDSDDLVTHPAWQPYVLDIGGELRPDAGIALEPFDDMRQIIWQLAGLQLHRTQVFDQFADVQHFGVKVGLNARQIAFEWTRGIVQGPAHRRQLQLGPEQGLNDTVVQLA